MTTANANYAWLHLFGTGMQYYIAGRAAARAQLIPVAGNLLHHAVEMLLKGDLSKDRSLQEIRQFQHNLVKTWDTFKSLHSVEDLSSFDQLIADLDRFEKIRYPDEYIKHGAVMSIGWNGLKSAVDQQKGSKLPEYCLYVNDVDALVTRLSNVCCVNLLACCGLPNPEVERFLWYENNERECDFWGRPPLASKQE